MKRISSLILAIVGLLAAPVAFAQSQQSWYFAADYGNWSVQSQSANTFLFSPIGLCIATASSGQFFPFKVGTPVLIADATNANSEVVTPSSITNSSSQCGVTVSPTNNHYSFQLKSGTGGLQEALNALAVSTSAYPAEVILDRRWYTAAASVPGKTAAGIIAAATGNTKAYLVDVTTAPETVYQWSGTKYLAVSGSVGGPTVPGISAGTGAGTGATVTVNGNGSFGIVNLTTGTSPATSSPVFSLAFATPANGGFGYAPACTFTSIGTNAYTSGSPLVTYSSIANASLISSATALTASTAYSFRYVCQ